MPPSSSPSMAIDSGTTEGLLSIVCKSIEAAETSRVAAESRANELQAQLHEVQTQRINELELEVQRLRAENDRLLSVRRRQYPNELRRAGQADTTGGAGSERVEARVAEVYAWLAELFLSSYADAIVSEGYDALECLLLLNCCHATAHVR